MMTKFRKKPVVIEAMQLFFDNKDEVVAFIGRSPSETSVGVAIVAGAVRLTIPTLEGDITAINGDWIIKGVAGEFYPCKPDIFRATYEAVDD